MLEALATDPSRETQFRELFDCTFCSTDGAIHLDFDGPSGDDELRTLLIELGGIEFVEGDYRLSNEFTQLLPPDQAERLPLTEESLRARLDLNARRGRLAEDYVVAWERRRLEALGRSDLATLVERISSRDVSRGYDVVSYDPVDGDPPERHIEVKAGIGEFPHFYISRNEVETAKAERAVYWIYLVPRVHMIPRENPVPILLQDPASLMGTEIVVTPEEWSARVGSRLQMRLVRTEIAPGVTAMAHRSKPKGE